MWSAQAGADTCLDAHAPARVLGPAPDPSFFVLKARRLPQCIHLLISQQAPPTAAASAATKPNPSRRFVIIFARHVARCTIQSNMVETKSPASSKNTWGAHAGLRIGSLWVKDEGLYAVVHRRHKGPKASVLGNEKEGCNTHAEMRARGAPERRMSSSASGALRGRGVRAGS